MLSEELQVYLLLLHCFSKAISFAGAKLKWETANLTTTTADFSASEAPLITLPPTISRNETFIGGSHYPLSNFAINKTSESEMDHTAIGDELFESTRGFPKIRGQDGRSNRQPFSRGNKPRKRNKLFEKASRKLFELLKDSSEFQQPQHRPGVDAESAELFGSSIRGPTRNRLRHHRHHQRTKLQFSQHSQAFDASPHHAGDVEKVSQPYAIMSGKRLAPEFCRAEPFKQRIHARGCRSQTFVNNYCYGHCHSFFVPQAYRKLTAAFQTSPCCRPRETRRAEIFLDCPRRRHRKQIRKVVVKIVSCVCTSQCD